MPISLSIQMQNNYKKRVLFLENKEDLFYLNKCTYLFTGTCIYRKMMH